MTAVAENISTDMPAPILFTDSAAAKVADLIAEEGNPDLKLRVFVQGGGCSGFQYGFTFDEITNEDDTIMSKNGVSLLIDAMSYQYLVGAETRGGNYLRWINTTQNTGAFCARDACDAGSLAQYRLTGQPGKGRCLHLQRWQPERIR